MTRLDLLKQEIETVKELRCLSFGIKDEVVAHYEREITAIEKWGASNPEYELKKSDNPYQE